MSQAPFQFFDHTADIGMHVYGATLEAIFHNACIGMLSIINDFKKPVRPSSERIKEDFNIEADNIEALLLKSLQEILFRIEIQGRIYHTLHIETISYHKTNLKPYKLKGYISGEPYNSARHGICIEIKAVTRHQFYIQKTNAGWKAKIIFDV